MPTIFFRGDAQGRAQVTHVTPANVEVGDTFTLTINRKDISVEATASTVANVVALFVAAIGEFANDIAEWAEVSASSGTNDDGDVTHLILTGKDDGTPFTVTSSVSDAGDLDVDVETIVAGVAPTNEIQRVVLPGPPTGGTFTLTFDGQTTAAIAYNADNFTIRDALCDLSNIAGTDEQQTLTSTATGGTFTLTFEGQTTGNLAFDITAANLKTALEALSNIAVDDVSLSGGPLNVAPIVVTFRNNLGRSNRTEMTADNTNATGGTVVPSTNVAGVASDVTVTGSATDFTVEFGGAYAGVNVPIMTGDGTSLTGGAQVTIATTTQGTNGTNEVQRVIAHKGNSDLCRLVFNGQTTASMAASATAAEMQSKLEALSTIGSGNVTVESPVQEYFFGDPEHTGSFGTDAERHYRITFVGALGNQNVALLTKTEVSSTPRWTDPDVVTEGSTTGTNEVQTVTVKNAPTAGTFTLTFSGQTTAGIAFNAADSAVLSALEALSNIAPGDVTVTRAGSGTLSSPYVYTVTFLATYASTDVAQMTSDASSLTGSAVSVATTQEASAGTNEEQQVELTGSPSGGTFTLTFNAETTGAIAYNASAATVQAALEALATPVPGDFSVTGADGGPWLVEFTGAYAASDVAAITGDGANLTGGGTQTLTVESPNETEPTGPHHLDDVENYSGGALPSAADTLIFANTSTDIKWGLDGLAGIALAEVQIHASFTGRLGLPPINNVAGSYFEYRQLAAQLDTDICYIGEGEGGGSPFMNLDFQAAATELIVVSTGRPDDPSLPALLVKGTNAANVFRFFRGSWGIALLPGEVATVETLQVGYISDPEGDSEGAIGRGVTLSTTLDFLGGRTTIDLYAAAAGAIVAIAGEVTIRGDQGASSLLVTGTATVFWNTTGTLGGAPVVADDATLDFSQDMRTKDVTNPIERQSRTALIHDPFKTVTDLRIDNNYVDATLDGCRLGNNIRVTRAATA